MKLPLTIRKVYKTALTKEEILAIITEQKTQKHFKGLRYDKFYNETVGNSFKIQRESFGLDALLEVYPLILGEFEKHDLTRLKITIKPNYFNLIFFSIFVVTFMSVAIFSNEMNINDVLKKPNLTERFLFSLGGIIPGIWCYVGFIRPIFKTQKWIENKFLLREL